jgi:Glycosyltransferase family 87
VLNILRKNAEGKSSGGESAARRHLLIALAIVLMAFGAKTTFSRIHADSPRYQHHDFDWYYTWGAEYSAGEALWTPAVASGEVRPGLARMPYCNYTPFAVKTMAWLARLPQQTAHIIWLYLQAASLMLAIWLLARSFEPALNLPATLVIISLGLFSQSFRQLLFYSQFASLLLLGVAGAWLAMRRRQPAIAGFCLAFVTLLKLYPGILAGYLIMRRRWRELGWMTAFFACGFVATNVKDWIAFARFVASPSRPLEHILTGPMMTSRASLWSSAHSATSWLNYGGSSSPAAVLLFSSVVGAGVLTVLIMTTLHTIDSDPKMDGLVFGLWIASGLIFSPLSWMHEFPLLIPAYMFAGALGYETIRRGWPPSRRFALVASIVMLGVCIVPELIHQLPLLRPPYLVPLAVLIGGALMLEARRNPGPIVTGSSKMNHSMQLEYEPRAGQRS